MAQPVGLRQRSSIAGAPLPARAARQQHLRCAGSVRLAVRAEAVKEKAKEQSQEQKGAPHAQPPSKFEGWPRKRTWQQETWDRVLESCEDVASHLQRGIRELPSTKALDRLLVEGKGGTLRVQSDKPVVVILGSGWAAHSIMKVIDTDSFEVCVVSPRNHFLFTPMLPSTAVGTIEFRSLLEPVRVANPFVDYFEASCDKIDLEGKVVYCTSKNCYEDGFRPEFQIPYDILVVAVGEQPATFGIPGVEEHCYFMKEIPDSVGLRQRIQQQFELAALPGTKETDMRRALHFVVVGGGPTGVEFAGTLSDFLREDLKKKYPELMPYVRVSLLNATPSILVQFDEKMRQHALDNFKRLDVDVRNDTPVVEVTKDIIRLGSGEELPYGVCVWSAGNAPRPLVKQLAAQIPEQAQYQPGGRPSKLAVDSYLRVIGVDDVVALGDASLYVPERLPATAQVAGQQGAYVAHLINRGFSLGAGGMEQPPPSKRVKDLTLTDRMHEMLAATMAPADDATAKDIVYYNRAFEFFNYGVLAYLGDDKALTQIELPGTSIRLTGALGNLIYKSVYITKQVSFRNRVLILFDWLKAQVFGRDLSNY
jgi:NADH:ubiquinone reductase (non-electrogenic)